jgi:hypothetical protein
MQVGKSDGKKARIKADCFERVRCRGGNEKSMLDKQTLHM